ncbi:helicase-related protein [Nonomuraea sp. NPDC049400]|uniref:helicase-related protein n=1 Tax=Nonomuraea sp. NPDC049400 TaxID=3364352 RepID=UPI00379741E4
MAKFLGSREKVLKDLQSELVGPKPLGKPLDLSKIISFPTKEDARGPWRDAATGEEILHDFKPLRRYGMATLAPAGEEEDLENSAPELGTSSDELPEPLINDQIIEKRQAGISRIKDELDDDLDLSLANTRKQSTIGISVHCQLPDDARIIVSASFGRYRSFQAEVAGSTRDPWWVRSPVSVQATFTAKSLAPTGARRLVLPDEMFIEGADGLEIQVLAFSRCIDGKHIVTITVTNRTSGTGDKATLFQAQFSAMVEGGGAFLPYPEERGRRQLDPEEQSIALLYRHHQTFALGHGCAADWAREPGETTTRIDAVCLPAFETPSVTPVILREDGSKLSVSMTVLAKPERREEAAAQVEEVIFRYQQWIAKQHQKIPTLAVEHQEAARDHLQQCEAALKRMRRGWQLVLENEKVATAFHLANQAMLDQQARSSVAPRETVLDEQSFVKVEGEPPTGVLPKGRGDWRPFQIAFFLAVLESIAHPSSDDRENVELIFFPTGGGKTEAYLAVAAFSMFLRRLRNHEDVGTEVIMRYTLRLLTAQQFLRAASLICAMERLREGRTDLGREPYTIGIWLGSATTPNRREKAVEAWKKLAKDPAQAANQFLLLRCPWCAARLGPTAEQLRAQGKKTQNSVIPGYRRHRDRVALECPDHRCPFNRGLPLLVVDQDIYEKPPSMVIGTVDKFAMIPWRPEARAIFGRDTAGNQTASPPGLIIQDEFHLISGPLGSMVGMYEAVIDDLCTDRRGDKPIKPKIIASTATIRRYAEQTKAVYGRESVALFPPPGLTAEDSFFAVWARDEHKKLLPGRLYVGVHAPGLGSIQSVQVRTAAALLQAPVSLTDDQKDPWWTCLWFFNSLRELGNTLSLLQADIPDYIVGLRRREGLEDVRFPRNTMELTSRRRNDEIPRAIDELSAEYGSKKAVDVCLSSNIIEVGVDIDRLSLMAIVGQPKTTSQYIQVSGRVGRRWDERPGLVITLYGAAKPRDRSHYERFRSYHERLYAQVEPTSVTPFARPVLKRALRGALIAHVRTTGPMDLVPWPVPQGLAEQAAGTLIARAELVDPEEIDAAEREITLALQEWDAWDRAEWDANPGTGDPLNGLMRYSGTPAGTKVPSWEVPSSMRNVDVECRAEITTAYNQPPRSPEEMP